MTESSTKATPMSELKKAVKCLYIELPESIAKDVDSRFTAVVAAHDTLLAERDRYRLALEKIRDNGPCPDHDCDCHVALAATALKEGE